jgi:hypothetical protein
MDRLPKSLRHVGLLFGPASICGVASDVLEVDLLYETGVWLVLIVGIVEFPWGLPLAQRLFAKSPATILTWSLCPIAVCRFARSFDAKGAPWGSSLAQLRYVQLFAAALACVRNPMSVRDFLNAWGHEVVLWGSSLPPRISVKSSATILTRGAFHRWELCEVVGPCGCLRRPPVLQGISVKSLAGFWRGGLPEACPFRRANVFLMRGFPQWAFLGRCRRNLVGSWP